jgi:hypothetical protein
VNQALGLGPSNELDMVEKNWPDRPWAAFPIQVHSSVRAFFSLAIISEVGNGKNTPFGLIIGCVSSFVPDSFGLFSKR